jgi:hypothetical protein
VLPPQSALIPVSLPEHRIAREGIHLFYRSIAWGNGSDEPIWSRAQLAANKQAATRKR